LAHYLVIRSPGLLRKGARRIFLISQKEIILKEEVTKRPWFEEVGAKKGGFLT